MRIDLVVYTLAGDLLLALTWYLPRTHDGAPSRVAANCSPKWREEKRNKKASLTN